jgi:DNA polymerase elongation subunit (family B)
MLNGFYTDVTRKGNLMLYRGYDEMGQKIYDRLKYRPRMFLPAKCEALNPLTGWHSIDGRPLEPMRFESMSDMKEFMKTYDGVKTFEIFGNDRHVPAFIQSQFPDEIKFDRKLINIATIDIEVAYEDGYSDVSDADNAIQTIAWRSSRDTDGLVRIWGTKDYDASRSISPNTKKEFRKFATEEEMMADFVNYWADPVNTPDIVTGWNSTFFDVPYIVNRISRIDGSKEASRLSPWGMVNEKRVTIMGRENLTFEIAGVQQLDFMDLFKKFCSHTYGTQESYKLDFIADVVLGDNKIDYSEHGTLENLYRDNYELFVDYNVKDVELVTRLEEKLGLINLACSMAYMGGVNYNDSLGTIAIWDSIIFRRLASQRVAVSQSSGKKHSEYPGGFVKSPDTGLFEWVVGFDVNSLYPNLIVQYNMSPETICKHLKVEGITPDLLLEPNRAIPDLEENLAMAASGDVFRRDKIGVIPAIVEEYYNRRVGVKKSMIEKKKELETIDKEKEWRKHTQCLSDIARLETEQTAIKILMNSLYGACANPYFRYFDIAIANAITVSGQYVIRSAELAVNAYLSKVLKDKTPKDRIIAMDTDSIYVAMQDLMDHYKPVDPVDFLDKFASKALEPLLEKTFAQLAKDTNAFKNTMAMKREAIASRGIWIAKKRYILNINNNEGVQYAKPKIKMVGIQAIQSSTPAVCRKEFKKMFDIIMNGTEEDLQTAIAEFREEFNKLPPEQVSFPRGVNNLNKYYDAAGGYKKGQGAVPIQARAALLFNHQLKVHGLEKKLLPIRSGDKLKFTYLKKNNPLKENVIGFHDTLPTEFGLDNFVDYDLQFEKAFIVPLTAILTAIQWSVEARSDLESFFS